MAEPLQLDDPQTDAAIDNYYEEISALLLLALAGRITKKEYIRRHELITLATIKAVYLISGGLETDRRFIQWYKEQTAIVKKSTRALANDVYSGRYSKKELDGRILQTSDEGRQKGRRRLGLWTFALGLAHHRGMLYKPFNGLVGTWHLGRTEKHCTTCAGEDGKTRTAAEWAELADQGIEPQGSGLECGGYNCDCSIDWHRQQ